MLPTGLLPTDLIIIIIIIIIIITIINFIYVSGKLACKLIGDTKKNQYRTKMLKIINI